MLAFSLQCNVAGGHYYVSKEVKKKKSGVLDVLKRISILHYKVVATVVIWVNAVQAKSTKPYCKLAITSGYKACSTQNIAC